MAGGAWVQLRTGSFHDPAVTWCEINYAGTQITQWDFQTTGTRTSPARLSFGLEVPTALFVSQQNLYFVACDRSCKGRAYCLISYREGLGTSL